MATKSVSTLVLFAILFLVIFETPETKAQDSECLKEYGGDVGFQFCAPKIFPSLCYSRCRADRGAEAGRCDWGEGGFAGVKCLCDYCSDEPSSDLNTRNAF